MDNKLLTRKIVDLAEWIGMAVHSGLRRLSNSPEAITAYEAIEQMPDEEWRLICLSAAQDIDNLMNTIADVRSKEALAYNREYSISYVSGDGISCIEKLSAPNQVDVIHIFIHLHPDFRDIQSVTLGW